MDKYLTPTTVDDITYIAPRLRTADHQECLAATGREPLGVLMESLEIGAKTLTMRSPTGQRVGLLGVVQSPIPEAGAIWLCATDDIYQWQMTFLRQSKLVLPKLQANYLALYNYVDARNTVHLKWLKWMGFTFINKHEHFGVEQRLFYEFVRI
jgi:hypothetical protein